jgi:hypothetical protein
MILAGLQQSVLFRLVNVEIGRANAKRVNIDGSAPVITVQMPHFLRIPRSFVKRFGVVKEILAAREGRVKAVDPLDRFNAGAEADLTNRSAR